MEEKVLLERNEKVIAVVDTKPWCQKLTILKDYFVTLGQYSDHPFDFYDIALNIAFAIKARGCHIADLAKVRTLLPGAVMDAVDPGHPGVRIWIAAINKIFVVYSQRIMAKIFFL